MDAANNIQGHPKMIEQAANSCLERARLYTKICDSHFEQLQNVSNKMQQ